jgi:hypothetical protein
MKHVRRCAVALATVAFAGAALAAGVAARNAFAGDGGTAAILDNLSNDAAHKAPTAAIVQRGRDALERAVRMRAAGDEAHAQLADGLAREEAETAQDLVRALDAERTADEARRAATDAGTVGERERALLEEGIARNGRLHAEIQGLGGSDRSKEPRTSKVGDAGGPPPARSAAGAPAVSSGRSPMEGGARSPVEGGARSPMDGGAR